MRHHNCSVTIVGTYEGDFPKKKKNVKLPGTKASRVGLLGLGSKFAQRD
jgi:hypothetical protein